MSKNYLFALFSDNENTAKEELRKCIEMGSKYRDPDSDSEQLYQDIQKKWNFTGYQQIGKRYNLIGIDGERYSSDFLGLSITKLRHAYQMYNKKEEKQSILTEIITYLEATRVLGGHMIWPVHTLPTINTYRADYRTYQDRFDLLLEDIRNFYLSRGKEQHFCKGFAPFIEARKREQNFFLQFGDGMDGFKNFIHEWKLESFIDANKDYRVISLVHSNLKEKIKYVEYIEKQGKYNENINDTIKSCSYRSKEQVKQNFYTYMNNTKIAIEERNLKLQEM